MLWGQVISCGSLLFRPEQEANKRYLRAHSSHSALNACGSLGAHFFFVVFFVTPSFRLEAASLSSFLPSLPPLPLLWSLLAESASQARIGRKDQKPKTKIRLRWSHSRSTSALSSPTHKMSSPRGVVRAFLPILLVLAASCSIALGFTSDSAPPPSPFI
jgi:hypothetical protein